MTQDELAQRAGCSVGALRKIKSGDRRPSKQLAALLAKALEIPPEDQPTFIRVARGELNSGTVESFFIQNRPISARYCQPSTPSEGTAPEESPPPASIHRIHFQAMPLVGRENELAAMERLSNDPQCRFLTLTGIGGIGKTRLAIEFALQRDRNFLGAFSISR